MVVVSRAPYGKLEEYRKRMGWNFKWVSSGGSDFNFDYQASFTPEEMAAKRALYNFTMRDPKAREREGHSIFYKDRGWRRLSHLLLLRPRQRQAQPALPLSRSGAQGAG